MFFFFMLSQFQNINSITVYFIIYWWVNNKKENEASCPDTIVFTIPKIKRKTRKTCVSGN